MLQQIEKHLSSSDRTAFVINDESYSYLELKLHVDRCYYFLMQHPKLALVGIVARDNIQTYAMMIATVLSDCGYVIINPANPPERNEQITSESGISVVLGSCIDDASLLPAYLQFIALPSLPAPPHEVCYTHPDSSSIAYVLFTSGTTGKPKGVCISKANLEALLHSLAKLPLQVTQDDRVLQMFDLSFDGSVLMLFMSLCAGAAIYTVNPDRIKYLEIARLMHSHKLSFVFVVPSVIGLLKPYLPSILLPDVRTFIVGAEAVSYSRLQSILPCIPNASVWNLYGPTEATVCVMAYQMDSNVTNELHNGIIPIGKPMPGVMHLVVDNNLAICAQGEIGELYVGGEQLCQGYINAPERNSIDFILYNWEGQAQRFYATGDLVYVNEFGNYMYCGRRDRQVKIQGNRIELAEIEHHARAFTDCEAIAMVNELDGVQSLYLFIENYTGTEADILQHLSSKLPAYMVPRQIISLSHLPKTDSDKTDLQQLTNELMLRINK